MWGGGEGRGRMGWGGRGAGGGGLMEWGGGGVINPCSLFNQGQPKNIFFIFIQN